MCRISYLDLASNPFHVRQQCCSNSVNKRAPPSLRGRAAPSLPTTVRMCAQCAHLPVPVRQLQPETSFLSQSFCWLVINILSCLASANKAYRNRRYKVNIGRDLGCYKWRRGRNTIDTPMTFARHSSMASTQPILGSLFPALSPQRPVVAAAHPADSNIFLVSVLDD